MHTAILFQVFLSNTTNLYTIIWFQVNIPIMIINENQRKWKEKQILGPCQRTKKAEEHMIPIVIGILGMAPKNLERELEDKLRQSKL